LDQDISRLSKFIDIASSIVDKNFMHRDDILERDVFVRVRAGENAVSCWRLLWSKKWIYAQRREITDERARKNSRAWKLNVRLLRWLV